MAIAYDERFYNEMVDTSTVAAEIIVPIVTKLVGQKSVIDVGCGEGKWLAVFKKNGAPDVYGADGEWVKPERLAIPKESFTAIDLEKPFTLKKTADLAVSLEVAEHLPPASADGFIASLAKLAPVILFSAAIPLQGGSHHVNEQWPAYWEAKFASHGYVPVDAIRRHIWDNPKVPFFYAQNLLIYVKKESLFRYPLLGAEIASGHDKPLPLVHPFIFDYYATRWRLVVPFLGKLPPSVLHRAKSLLATFRRKA